MAALGWLMNLGFAAGGDVVISDPSGSVQVSPNQRKHGYGYRYLHTRRRRWIWV